jgi:hypothetical protein
MKTTSPRPGSKSRVATWRICALVLLLAGASKAAVATFDDLTLPPQSYWNGADGSGGFRSGEAFFANNYNAAWDSWDGFAYSNGTDTRIAGMDGQYNVIAGSGQGGSAIYGIAFVGWEQPPTITLRTPRRLRGLYVTNNDFVYYALRDGSPFSKKIGGATGADPDWFKLSITGKDTAGHVTGTIDFYLADFRFADSKRDYIVNSWQFVDLTALGQVKTLQFALSSSDSGAFGMNTPGYFCLDTLVPEPAAAHGGPYTETGINGYIDPMTWRHADPLAPKAVLNPIWRGWATKVVEYSPAADQTWSGPWNDPNKALGPATGQSFDVVSLGELNQKQITLGLAPGHITLAFGDPGDPNNRAAIRNGKGYDFVVFENAFLSQFSTPMGSVQGQMLAELAYVEVSTNGRDFVRFPSVSLTPGRVGPYGTIEISNVHNLAGKHPNANGICTGTPFDLEDLARQPLVLSGAVDLNDIRYVRIVDVPGSGDFLDDATEQIDPNTWPKWACYTQNHPIYDMWPTWGSGGFDLEAIGVLREQEWPADINLDGVVDYQDLSLLAWAWQCRFGDEHWNGRCDLAQPKNLVIDGRDFAVFAAQWRHVERWRTQFKNQ